MLKVVCVWICVFCVPMSLYERGSIPEGSYIHFQGHLLFPGSLMCLSLQNVCGAHRALVTGFQTTTCKRTERGRCCMNRVCNIPQNLQVCKLCFLDNIMESQRVWFKYKSHSSVFLQTKCFHNKPLKRAVADFRWILTNPIRKLWSLIILVFDICRLRSLNGMRSNDYQSKVSSTRIIIALFHD